MRMGAPFSLYPEDYGVHRQEAAIALANSPAHASPGVELIDR